MNKHVPSEHTLMACKHESNCPNYIVEQTGCAICAAPFVKTGVPREGAATCTFVYKRIYCGSRHAAISIPEKILLRQHFS